MSNKYSNAGYGREKPGPGYNYVVTATLYHHHPTEKQMKYMNGLIATCERVGIDLSDFKLRKTTKNGVKSSINALITLLKRHGYDTHGNKIEEDK